jgi:quercetin dioxygenase-like cupin family protein
MTMNPRMQTSSGIIQVFIWMAIVGLFVSACGSTGSTAGVSAVTTPTVSPAQGVGFTSSVLANGHVDALPPGTLFANILSISQPASSSIPAHSHVALFIYEVSGIQTLAIQGQTSLTLQAGSAAFLPNHVTHTHSNPGSSTNLWYVIGLRPRGVSTTPPNVTTTPVYSTPDLPASAPGAYWEVLRLATLQPGGRSPAHKHSGLEVILVIDGTLTLHSLGQSPQTMTAGQGAYVLPNTPLQVLNTGSSTGHYLAFLAWPVDQPFQTNVSQAP